MSYLQVQRNPGRRGQELSYAHLAASVWSSEKKRSVQRRLYLGRLSEDGTEVVISKGFPSRSGTHIPVEELRTRLRDGEDLEAWLRLPAGGSGRTRRSDAPARVEVVGDAHLLLTLARETGIEEILVQVFGPKDGLALLGLAIHQTVEARPLYLAGDWLAERELPPEMKGKAVSTDRVYGLIMRFGKNHDGRERFFRAWFHRHKSAHALLSDTTSISTYSAELELAEFGYNRDGEKLPQINVGLVADKDSGLPLWCRAVPGSIPDVRTLTVTAELLQDLGLEQFTASLDRGFYSRSNLRDLLNAGLDFVIGVPFSVKQARALVRKHRGALASPKRSFPAGGGVMRHVCDTWSVDMGKEESRTVDAHVFLEPARRAERVLSLEARVFALEDKASTETFGSHFEARLWLKENAAVLAKCFRIEGRAEDQDGVQIRRKPRAVALAAARMGYTLVLSSRRGASAEEILADYRSKDQVEKLFDCLKNELSQSRLRTGFDASAAGRLFLAFTALVLHTALENRMRQTGLLRKMTVAELLAQVRKIKAVTTRTGKRVMLEIAKRNRRLLATLGVPMPR